MDTNVPLTKERLQVLQHIALHDNGGRHGVRVPDAWIAEANASIADGQTGRNALGRYLTDAGRAALSNPERTDK